MWSPLCWTVGLTMYLRWRARRSWSVNTRASISNEKIFQSRSSALPAPPWCGSYPFGFRFCWITCCRFWHRVELAARIAKEEALQAHPELQPSDICVLFISPCPAKVSYVRSPLGVKESAVDGVLSISDIYFDLIDAMKHITTPRASCKFGIIGISWAGSGGESSALFNDKYLAADGIENVIQVLDEIEKENFAGLEFVELNACSGGCVGGAMNVENPFIAKARLQKCAPVFARFPEPHSAYLASG